MQFAAQAAGWASRGQQAGLPATNVTVNIGVAGDPEGVAREVVNVINNSFTRGTGGAGGLFQVAL